MRSSSILAVHTAMFATFMVASPTLSILVMYHPELFRGRGLALLCVTGIVVTLGIWRRYGECPLTTREKGALVAEGRQPYEGPWLTHYIYKLSGVRLPDKFGTYLSLTLLLWPTIVGIRYW